VLKWKFGEKLVIPNQLAGFPFCTAWIEQKTACVPLLHCHRVDVSKTTEISHSKWKKAKMEWHLYANELPIVCETITRKALSGQTVEEEWRVLCQLAFTGMEPKELVVGPLLDEVRGHQVCVSFVKNRDRWIHELETSEIDGCAPQLHIVGVQEKERNRTVVVLFSKDWVCYDQFNRLSGEGDSSVAVDVQLPASKKLLRRKRLPDVEPADKAKAEASGILLKEVGDEDFKNLWAAEEWVNENFRRRQRLQEEEQLGAGEEVLKELGMDLRSAWYQAQRGLIEHYVIPTGMSQGVWVPVVLDGEAATGMTLKFFCFKQEHVGVLGAHRGANKMFERLSKVCYWENMKKDFESWVSQRIICIRGRKGQ